MPETREIEAHLTALFSEVEAHVRAQEDTPVSIEDLKDSAAARRQARRQDAVFRSLVESSIDAISVSDLEGNQTYCNRACYDVFGYDYERQEMKGMPLSSLWPRKGVRTLTEQVFPRARTRGWSGETQLRRRDGAPFDAYLTAFPVLDGGEQSAGVAVIIRDVSERKALERERMYRLRAQQVQLVTEVSQEIATATSLNELYRRVVNVIKERFGYWHVQVFRHDPDLSSLALVETCVQTEKGMEDAERRLADARGSVVAAAASGQPILIPDVGLKPHWVPYPDLPNVKGELAVPIKLHDQVLGVLDVLSDKADALTRDDEILLVDLASQVASAIQSIRLLEEASLLRQFADAPEGIGWITLEGSLFIYANPTLCGILGEDRPENTFGKSILSYYPHEMRQRVRDEVLPIAIREGQWVGELSFLSRWGKVIPTMQSIFLVRDDHGEPIYLANVVTDISEQKQVESAADRRLRQIGCLNDIGRRIEAGPQVPEFLQWVAGRVPHAMAYPDVCRVAIEFKGLACADRTVYGEAEAVDLPYQVVENLTVCGEVVGRVHVSYAEERQFSDEDKTLVGDIARRVSSYIESRHLSEQAQAELDEVRSAHQLYVPGRWAKGVAEATPAKDSVPPGVTAQSDVRLKARLGKKGAGGAVRSLLRRVFAWVFVLVAVVLLLAAMLLATNLGSHAQGVTPAPTAVAMALAGPLPDPAVLPSSSSTPTSDPIPIPSPSPTRELFATSSPSYSPTPLPTTPPTPEFQSTDLIVPSPFPAIEPAETSTLPIPSPVQPVPVAPDAVNIVILGSDQRPDWSQWHTDAVHVVSVQRERGVVSVISIPRDLYLYIPGFWMSRINFADFYGEAYGYEGGGPALVRDTLLYNLGIRVDHYVRTNFDGLIGIVDTIGGVDIPVHCGISDHWPYPDENGEYPILTMEPGVQHMDGETTLWYSRSRLTTSVFSRERRQQQVLQALWHKLRNEMTLAQIPSLWEQGRDMVETDLTLADIVSLAPVASALEDQNVRFYNIGFDEVEPWTTPQGGAVFLPHWEAIQPIVAEAMAPVPEGRLANTSVAVEVWNGTPNAGWDALAADRLHRAGFSAVIGEPDRHDYAKTQLILFRQSTKGTGIGYLQQMFNIADEQVLHQPGGSAEFGFRLILGADYRTCPTP